MLFNYPKICSDFLRDLPARQKELLLRRFALRSGMQDGVKRETLESIGRDFGVTRERVRQIEKEALNRIKPKLAKYKRVFQYFEKRLKETGGLRKEDVLLAELCGRTCSQHTFFLLTLAEPFSRFAQTRDFHAFWFLKDTKVLQEAKAAVADFYNKLTEAKKPIAAQTPRLEYFLEISKVIQRNSEGLFGFKTWPEINPRSIKDKAFVALKRAGQPLHFRDVALHIGPDALPQTVHNELIRDPRFVLVGRGLYALKEWGFMEGDVKDVIFAILTQNGSPMSKEELLEKVLAQRLVKKSTVLLNLNNKKYFLRDSQAKYQIKEA